MRISFLLILLLLISTTSYAEPLRIQKDGYTYEVTKKGTLAVVGKGYKRTYHRIRLETSTDNTRPQMLLGTLNGMPAIVHYGSVEKHFVPTYFTLKTSAEGVTTIDCIYRKGSFTRRSERIVYLPYSVCNVSKPLTLLNLKYRLPQVSAGNFELGQYPFRIKISQLEDVSLYYYYVDNTRSMPDYLVQYKNKQIQIVSGDGDYILGPFNDKKGLFRITEKEYLSGVALLKGIGIEELKKKILNEGFAFDLNNPQILTKTTLRNLRFFPIDH